MSDASVIAAAVESDSAHESSPTPWGCRALCNQLDAAVVDEIRCGGARVAMHSSPSPDREAVNEDCAAVLWLGDASLVAILADGMGGGPDGDRASAAAVSAMADQVRRAAAPEALREAILGGFEAANAAVCAIGGGAATTLVVVELVEDQLRTYHVGDSGVLVFGGRGAMRLQTISHSPVGYALEAGILDERTAMGHDERHVVSNVVGDPGMHIGLSSPVELRPRDTVVIASDGLFDNLLTDEIVAVMRSGPLERGLRDLVAACRARMAGDGAHPGKPDDLTVLALRRAPAGAGRAG